MLVHTITFQLISPFGQIMRFTTSKVDDSKLKMTISYEQSVGWSELIRILKLGNVCVFVQLIHRPLRTKNKLYKNPNIA